MRTDVQKVAVAGDWHGNQSYALKAINWAAKQNVDSILHVGDFGFWRSPDGYSKTLGERALKLGIEIFFVDGNHENHDLLDSLPISDDGTRAVAPGVTHLPRGFTWDWNGGKWLALGGAHSVDRQLRREHIDWFRQETLSLGDAFRASSVGQVDFMVTHDCPDRVLLPGIDNRSIWEAPFPIEELALARQHREFLGQIVDVNKPKFLFHGHYHKRTTLVRDYPDSDDFTWVEGLNMDGTPFEENMMIVHSSNMSKTDVDSQ